MTNWLIWHVKWTQTQTRRTLLRQQCKCVLCWLPWLSVCYSEIKQSYLVGVRDGQNGPISRWVKFFILHPVQSDFRHRIHQCQLQLYITKQNNSVEKNHFWEANSASASRKNSRILWNKRFRHRIHNRPPLVPIRLHISPVQAPHSVS